MSRSRDRRPEKVATSPQAQGPNRRRSTVTVPQQLDGDACREAVSFLLHCNDETVIFEKMKMTFQHRQNLVHDPQRTTDVLKTFPRFLDIKGLVSGVFIFTAVFSYRAKCWQFTMAFYLKYFYVFMINS